MTSADGPRQTPKDLSLSSCQSTPSRLSDLTDQDPNHSPLDLILSRHAPEPHSETLFEAAKAVLIGDNNGRVVGILADGNWLIFYL